MRDWLKKYLLTENFGLVVIAVSMTVLVISVVVFLWFGNWTFSTVLCEEQVGQFGDFVGGVVGTLLAFSASILYYVALKAQQKDVTINQESLNRQIVEFSNQVKEQKLSREIYESQLKTMNRQQFETSFYSFFSIYQSVRKDIFINRTDSLVNELRIFICHNIKNNTRVHTLSEANKVANESYLKFFIKHENMLSYYFRTLYRLIKQIDSSPLLTKSEKWFYSKLVRSQMSTDELYLNYYNSFSPFSIKSRDLLYKYNFFKHFAVFSKTEIQQLNNIDSDLCAKLILFSQIITPEIIKYINSICDNIEVDHYEVRVDMFNCNLKIEQRTSDINFQIYHDPYYIMPDNFQNIFAHYLEDVLFLSSYKNLSKSIYATKSIDTITRKTVYSFSVPVEIISRLINDDTYDQ